ncbi:hypothetical protein [Variovorax rhizosphaerae]|uniref:Uncharacterized protein n=1 Tax=Variovorax rhizosphaerae TaxID=1836200 RepID=A0ABU8WFY8_9BURK
MANIEGTGSSDLRALRIEMGTRLARADGARRAELKPLALQVNAIASALEKLKQAGAAAPIARDLSAAERAEIDALETELTALVARVEALEKRPPVFFGGVGGAPGPAGPAGPPGPPAIPAFSYFPMGF